MDDLGFVLGALLGILIPLLIVYFGATMLIQISRLVTLNARMLRELRQVREALETRRP